MNSSAQAVQERNKNKAKGRKNIMKVTAQVGVLKDELKAVFLPVVVMIV